MRGLLLVLVLSTSCAEPPAPRFEIVRPFSLQSCMRVFSPRSPTAVDVLIADRPVVLEFQVTGFLECAAGRVGLESISVTLVDDASELIHARVEVLGFDPTVRTVKVSFQPPQTSAVQLRLVVEPSIGTFSQSLPIVRTSTRSWSDVPRRRCEGLLEGPGAQSLCVRNSSVEFANRSIPVNAAAASPAMLWLFTNSAFDAWRLDGGDAELVVSHPFDFRYPIAVAARGGRVATALPDGVSVFDEDGGVRWAQIQPQSPSIQGLAFLDDETLLLARPGRTDRVSIAALDGVVTLAPSNVTDVSVVTSDEGFWRVGFEPISTLERFDGGRASMPERGLRPAIGVMLPDLVPLMSVGRAANTALVGVPIPALDGGIGVDLVEVPSELTVQWITSRWIFATRQRDGALMTAPRLP